MTENILPSGLTRTKNQRICLHWLQAIWFVESNALLRVLAKNICYKFMFDRVIWIKQIMPCIHSWPALHGTKRVLV